MVQRIFRTYHVMCKWSQPNFEHIIFILLFYSLLATAPLYRFKYMHAIVNSGYNIVVFET